MKAETRHSIENFALPNYDGNEILRPKQKYAVREDIL